MLRIWEFGDIERLEVEIEALVGTTCSAGLLAAATFASASSSLSSMTTGSFRDPITADSLLIEDA